MTLELEPRAITGDLPEVKREPGLVEIAARLLVRVAPIVWRSGISKRQLANDAMELAAMLLNSRARPAVHRKLGHEMGTIEISDDGTFWGHLDPLLANGRQGATGPHTHIDGCLTRLEYLYEGRAG